MPNPTRIRRLRSPRARRASLGHFRCLLVDRRCLDSRGAHWPWHPRAATARVRRTTEPRVRRPPMRDRRRPATLATWFPPRPRSVTSSCATGGTLRLRPPSARRRGRVRVPRRALRAERLPALPRLPAFGRETVEPFLDPDWARPRRADRDDVGQRGRRQVVALANYVRLRDPRRAEVAFAVADALQGQGVGTRLLEQLAATAAAPGISTFVAEVHVRRTGDARRLRRRGLRRLAEARGRHDRGPA